jgi:hypothetical protein
VAFTLQRIRQDRSDLVARDQKRKKKEEKKETFKKISMPLQPQNFSTSSKQINNISTSRPDLFNIISV